MHEKRLFFEIPLFFDSPCILLDIISADATSKLINYLIALHMVQSFDEPSTSDHCILDLPPTECCCPPGLNIGGCGPGILHWFCSTMHHRTSLLLVVTLQIYLNTFIVYSNNLDSNISIEVSWDSTFHTKI